MSHPTVAVLGGGVAGLSAAHELIERGFSVRVYEHRDVLGGKARSVNATVADDPRPTAYDRDKYHLPGEHGFRFFPSFYRHVTDTMKRIPYPGNRQGVYDNLVGTTRLEMTLSGKREFTGLDHFPRSVSDLKLFLTELLVDPGKLKLSDADLEFFSLRYWQILTSSTERRWADYEKLGWWDYVGAEGRSPLYQQLLAQGMTRSLVAANARVANAKSEGDVGLQLILDMFSPFVPTTDRVLNGPTSDVWIRPWYEYLKKRGVEIHLDSTLTRLECRQGKIERAFVDREGEELEVRADYYLVATPVEAFAKILSAERHRKAPKDTKVLENDPTLEGVIELARRAIASMNGIQFFLYRDVPITHGHVVIEQSPWALTAISQPQFWPHFDLARCGDGKVRGIISVDISEWGKKGTYVPYPAKGCTKEEVAYEVWQELLAALVDEQGNPILRQEDLHSWFLDTDVHLVEGGPLEAPSRADGQHIEYRNDEPLFISIANTWGLRPEAYTRIPNLMLASDYVRTYTQLATMEAANEAARRAVNAIIDHSGVKAPLCELWNLQEPSILLVLRLLDKIRYSRGLPWREEVPGLVKLAHWLWVEIHKIAGRARGRQ